MERKKGTVRIPKDEQRPPTYAQHLTQAPTTFPIGDKNVHPLVNITELQAHLRILGAFDILKWKVQDHPRPDGMSTHDAWALFVNRAVHRFYAYLQAPWPAGAIQASSEATMPPLDVLMVWHSYLLNPRTYYEDSHRAQSTYHSNLRSLRSMPVTLIASLIEHKSLEPHEPSRSRVHNFESLAAVPFEHPIEISLSETLPIACPRCLDAPLVSVPWWTSDWTGFSQDGFKAACAVCEKSFTKETIGVKRLCDELTLRRSGTEIAISETLLDSFSGRLESSISDLYMENMLTGFVQRISEPFANTSKSLEVYAIELGELADWNMASLSGILAAGQTVSASHLSPQRLSRLCIAYSQPGPAAVDLADAVIHHGLFIDRIVKLGWTSEAHFQSQTPLLWSIARYHAFLSLMATHPQISLVPTVDIDLAWHTHQLNAEQYRTDTTGALGMAPIHHIRPQEPSHGYDVTSRAWKKAFNVPYSVCECCRALPSPSRSPRSPEGLRNMMGRLLRGGKEDQSHSPAMETTLAALSPLSAGDADATHRSEHHLGDVIPASSR